MTDINSAIASSKSGDRSQKCGRGGKANDGNHNKYDHYKLKAALADEVAAKNPTFSHW